MNRKAIVIGAGFGGLALAIRLQSAGIDTTLVEARDRPGGRAYMWEKDGFVFDAGPTVITDPDCLGELWRLSGHDMAEDVSLVPVSPFYRLNWRRSEEHTSELQSLMRISYAVFCLKKKKPTPKPTSSHQVAPRHKRKHQE